LNHSFLLRRDDCVLLSVESIEAVCKLGHLLGPRVGVCGCNISTTFANVAGWALLERKVGGSEVGCHGANAGAYEFELARVLALRGNANVGARLEFSVGKRAFERSHQRIVEVIVVARIVMAAIHAALMAAMGTTRNDARLLHLLRLRRNIVGRNSLVAPSTK
jgi:hypothetical protein